jgi:hypothetical protein
MKKFIVEQVGMVQVEAGRKFVVEVPDDCTEEQAEELFQAAEESMSNTEGMGWTDDNDRLWVGFDVEIDDTDIYEPITMKEMEELSVITLGVPEEAGK